MKTSLKNYYLIGDGITKIVLSESIQTIRKSYPDSFVQYSGPVTKNELFLGIDRIKGKEIAPGVYENRLYQ